MLDLQAGVHLEEIEVPVAAHDELDRAGRIVTDRLGERDRLCPHLAPQRLIDHRRRRFLDDLLVTPLDGAFALAEMDDIAVTVAEHLDFHVAGVLDVTLDENAIVAEGRTRLGTGGAHALGQLALLPDDAHALAAAAGRRLDHHRQADLAGDGDRLGLAVDGAEMTGNGRHARGGSELLRTRSCRPSPRSPGDWGR